MPKRDAPRRRLTAREKTRRDDEIVRARMLGRSWASIATEHSLSQRQCQSIMREYRASNPTVRDRDPIELLDDMLERYEGAQDQLAEIAASSTHDATRVGAIRTSLEALRAQADLLVGVGVLPSSLNSFRLEADVKRTADAIFEALDRCEVPDAVYESIETALESANGYRSGDPH